MQQETNNSKNPYKGLYPYQEGDESLFYGRKAEINKLLRLVEFDLQCIVYGKSGIGKTSLLNAGLFPELNNKGFLPIRIKLDYLHSESSLLEQIKTTISKALEANNIQVKEGDIVVTGFREKESLWEYFRRVKHTKKESDKIIIPVLVFDQFEELFTLGKNHPEMDEFINQLFYLIEKQDPEDIKKRVSENREIIPYLDAPPTCRLVFSLREDYFPDLNEIIKNYKFKYLGQNIYRVQHMNGHQAREVMNIPGGLENNELIEDILKLFYPEDKGKEQQIPDEKLEIEPSILSLLCYQLFNRRESRLLNRQSCDKILTDFYESEMREFPVEAAKFIESTLLTEGGFRLRYPLEPNHPLKEHLEELVNRRILRRVYINENEHIEIVHDVLAPIIIEKRNRRDKKKRNIITIFLSILVLLLLALTFYAFSQKDRADIQYKNAQINRLAAEALSELPKDNTRAIRIAEAAYKLGLPNPPARTCRVLSSIGYSSFDKPFYNNLLHHNSSFNTASFSPDGQKILISCEDGTAKLLDLKKNETVDLKKHKSRIMSAVFSPDGATILTASWDKSAKLWDIKGKFFKEFRHGKVVSTAIFSPDGLKILTASWDKSAKLWNLEGESLMEFKHNGAVSSAVFSPDPDVTKILTASWDKSAKLWNLKGELLMEFIQKGAVSSAVFSSDGRKILTASDDGTAKLWDLKGDLLADLNKHKKKVISALFSPDGNRILTASTDNTAKIWDLKGNLLANLNKHKGEVNFALFFPDGSRILTATEDGIAKEWYLKSNLLVNLNKHETVVCSALFSPDNRYILTVSDDKTVKLWDLDGNLLVDTIKHNEKVSSAMFSPDGKRILTASWDHTAKLWDMKGNLLNDSIKHKGKVLSAVFSPDGSLILTASADNTVKIWHLNEKIFQTLDKHGAAVTRAVFSPDGNRLLTASEDGTAKLWDLEGKHLVDLTHKDIVTSAVFSVYGQILTASKDCTAKLWNLQGNLLVDLNKHKGVVNSAVFSPDGKNIVTSSDDCTAKLWDREGNVLITFSKHDKAVFSAAFSPNGKQIVTASDDGTAKLWDLEGNLLADFKHNGVVNSAVFSPDGSRIVTTSSDKTAKVWYTPKAILKWLNTAKIKNLSKSDMKELGIH